MRKRSSNARRRSRFSSQQAPPLEGVAQHEEHAVALERLLHEVERAETGGLDRGRDRAVAGDHDHRQLGLALPQLGQDLEPVHARHLDVEQHGVGLQRLHAVWRRFRAGGRLRQLEALVFEDHA